MAALLFCMSPLSAQDNTTCLSCHGQKMEGIPFVNEKEFNHSIHGKNLCVPATKMRLKSPTPQSLRLSPVPIVTELKQKIYLQSDHGRALSRGVSVAATCTSCHGHTHTLLSSRDPRSPVHRKNIPNTCAVCHANKEKMAEIKLTEKEPFDTYLHSVHGVAFKDGKANAAVCSDCHGTHDLHSASNPESKIYRATFLTLRPVPRKRAQSL